MPRPKAGGRLRGGPAPDLWRILVAAVLFAAVILLVPTSRARTVLALLLPVTALVAISVPWLRGRSSTRRTKLLGCGLALAAASILQVGSTFPTTAVALLWGVPGCVGVTRIVFRLWPDRARSSRPAAVGAGFVASLVPWLLVTMDGVTGRMMPHLVWKWRAPSGVSSSGLPPRSVAGLQVPSVASAGDWPGFRGPRRDGVAQGEGDLGRAADWVSRPPSESWRRPIGQGWSSFAVVGDLACTQDQANHLERVLCLDARNGKTFWAHSAEARFDDPAGGPGPRGTPLIHEGRLYSLGATGTVRCFDAESGTLLWSFELTGEDGRRPPWGFASSPLVYRDLVYVSPAGVGGVRIQALDRRTGRPVWEARGDFAGYGSVQLAVLDDTPQVLLFDGGGLVSYAPISGDQLWSHDWVETLPRVAQPHVVPGDLVIVGMGYGRGTRALHVVRRQGRWSVEQRWETSRFKPKFNDFVVHDGHLYGLDEGILACVDVHTGERRWKAGRYGYGQLLLLGSHLVIVSESGDLVLVEATGDGHHELARFPVLAGKSWSHPAIARGRLFLRNGSEAVGYDLVRRVGT